MISRRIYDHVRRNVWGIAAMFVALTGTAVALPGKNTVDSGDIINNQVRSKDVKDANLTGADLQDGAVDTAELAAESVDSSKVAPDSLTGANVAEQSLGPVPAAANAEALDSVDSSGFLRWGQPIPSGVTVTGVFRAADKNDGTSHTGASAETAVSFPAPAPADLTVGQVNFAPGSLVGNDDDAACTGDVNNPTAPPGKVCLYDATSTGVNDSASGGAFAGGASRFGFHITGPSTTGSSSSANVAGTWAYTAP